MIQKSAVILLLILFLSAHAWASPAEIDQGIEAMNNGDYQTAFNIFEPLAKQGDHSAQSALAALYYNGKGVETDYLKALEYGRPAAESGQLAAQYMLGLAYLYGNGVPKNLEKSLAWLKLSGSNGFPMSSLSLANLYFRGLEGVKKDPAESFKWATRAAEFPIPDAYLLVAKHYEQGAGVKKSESKAAEAYLKAADLGHPIAQYEIGKCYASGKGVARSETEARRWMSEAAKNGNSDAANWLLNPPKAGSRKK